MGIDVEHEYMGQRKGILFGILLSIIIVSVGLISETGDDLARGEGVIALSLLSILVAGYVGATRWRSMKTFEDDVTKPEEATVGDAIGISGEITEVTNARRSPFGDVKTPFVQWTVEERDSGLGGRRAYWKHMGAGIQSGEMTVQTEDGTNVTVALDDATNVSDGSLLAELTIGGGVVLSDGHTIDGIAVDMHNHNLRKVIEPDEPLPQHVAEFLSEQGIDPPKKDGTSIAGPADGSHRYTEYGLSKGDTVFIRGEVSSSGWEPTITTASEGPTVVSDLERDAFMTRLETIVYACGTLVSILGLVVSLTLL